MKKFLSILVLLVLSGCSKISIELEPTFKYEGKDIINVDIDDINNLNLLSDLIAVEKGSNNDLISNVRVEGELDYNTPGSYEITYVLEYNRTTYTIKRTVVINAYKSSDLELVLNGSTTMKVLFNTEFIDPYVTATNMKNGENLTHLVEVEGNVDTSVEGFYTLVYKINYRGVVKTRTRDVQVLEDPGLKLSLHNNTDQYNKYIVGDKYVEYGINIVDNFTGNIIPSDEIHINGNFDTEIVGTYYVEYSVEVRGKTYTIIRTVIVSELFTNFTCSVTNKDWIENYTCSYTLNDKNKLPETLRIYAFNGITGNYYNVVDNKVTIPNGYKIIFVEYTYKNISYTYAV